MTSRPELAASTSTSPRSSNGSRAGGDTWAGIRIFHLLNTFTPRDVQNDLHAPDFRGFYNSIPRKLGLNFYNEP